jgi:hypothetical protein
MQSEKDKEEELDYLRWWYIMHTPNLHLSGLVTGNMPTKEEMRELWKKNTGKEVPRGYKEEDEVW